MLFEILNCKDLVNYDDLNLDKPVKYDQDSVKNLADCNDVLLTHEHDNIAIGNINELVFDEGTLYAKIANNILKDGEGLSPLVDATLKDMGDYYLATDLELVNIGKTTKPRNKLLFNNIKGDDKMSEEIGALKNKLENKENEIKKLNEKIKSLQKDNNELKANAKIAIDNKDFLESKEELLDELATFRNEKKLSEIATVEEKYGISYEDPDEKVMIDRVLAKDIDLELMETLTSKRAAIKENNSEVDGTVPGARGSGETVIDNSASDEGNIIKNREDYNSVLRDLGLNSEIR